MSKGGAGETQDLPGTTQRGGGRRDRDGTEETIKIQPIKDGSAELMKLIRRAEDAKTKVNEGFKALAERSNTSVASLKKLFKASFKGNFADVRHAVDQQSVLFETVGEIPGGGKGAGDEK